MEHMHAVFPGGVTGRIRLRCNRLKTDIQTATRSAIALVGSGVRMVTNWLNGILAELCPARRQSGFMAACLSGSISWVTVLYSFKQRTSAAEMVCPNTISVGTRSILSIFSV